MPTADAIKSDPARVDWLLSGGPALDGPPSTRPSPDDGFAALLTPLVGRLRWTTSWPSSPSGRFQKRNARQRWLPGSEATGMDRHCQMNRLQRAAS